MNILEKIENAIDELNEIRSLIIDQEETASMQEEEKNVSPLRPGSYVYRHWSGEGKGRRCVYIGSGTHDRAWSPREGREEDYTVEILLDGLDRDTAYRLESTFMEDYAKTHKGAYPKYNIDGTPEYFPAVDGMSGPWQLVFIKDVMEVAKTSIFKTDIRNVVGLLKSAGNNKIGFSKGPWVTNLSRSDYDYVTIRRTP